MTTKVSIFGVDDVLFYAKSRGYLINYETGSRDVYNQAGLSAPGIPLGIALARAAIAAGHRLAFFTSRSEKFLEATKKQIADAIGAMPDKWEVIGIDDDANTTQLLGSPYFKRTMLKYLTGLWADDNLEFVQAFDSRPDVVEMYLDEGIDACLVNDSFLESGKDKEAMAQLSCWIGDYNLHVQPVSILEQTFYISTETGNDMVNALATKFASNGLQFMHVRNGELFSVDDVNLGQEEQ